MSHYVDFSLASSESIETALGLRLEEIRLSRNITQSQLAREAGVSRSTIARLAQSDKGISLDSFIRIMQALQLHGRLEAMLPDPGISPLLRTKSQGKQRRRARPRKTSSKDWTWGDERAVE